MQQRRRGGFLIEGAMLTAVVAITAAVAVPGWLRATLAANEAAAVATLRQIARAQAEMRALAAIDCDRDGRGEGAYFGELSGSVGLRLDEIGGVSRVRLRRPLLPRPFGRLHNGAAAAQGYLFQLYLPSTKMAATPEAVDGGSAGRAIVADGAEHYWACYAWPMAYGSSGLRAFFVNQDGRVLASDNKSSQYSGGWAPLAAAAFRAGMTGMLDMPSAVDTIGADGARWVTVR